MTLPLDGVPRAVILVEGVSDRGAVEALAERRGRDLRAERVAVVPIGGAQAVGGFLSRFGPEGLDVRLAGLCDAGEEGALPARSWSEPASAPGSRGPTWSGWASSSATEDLEDELIRALGGAARRARSSTREGDLGSFRTLPETARVARTVRPKEQLRRFMGSGGGRKIRYGRLLVEALDLDRIPRPLAGALDHVSR